MTSGRKRNFREILMEDCVTSDTQEYICSIDPINGCKYRQKKEKFDPGNFIRHMRLEHPTLAKAHGLIQEKNEVPAKRRKVTKVPVAIDRPTLLEGILKLVCSHNMPILSVEWEGLRVILNPLCDALKMELNRPNLVRHLRAAADKLRAEVRVLVREKLICLKIDSATRLGRHILGVNIQYFDPEQNDIVIYTIGKMVYNVSMMYNLPSIFLIMFPFS